MVYDSIHRSASRHCNTNSDSNADACTDSYADACTDSYTKASGPDVSSDGDRYTSTYPYNPYLVPWTNSLFENAPADAMGVRSRWDQIGWEDYPLWCIGGDGAMFDIGFQSLSRMLASGMNINVFVLDTQLYSNTGGQASTSTYTGQNTKMSLHGKEIGDSGSRLPIAGVHASQFDASLQVTKCGLVIDPHASETGRG